MQQAVQQAGTETGPDPSREGAKDMMKLYPMDQLLEMAGMVLAKSESMKDYSMKHSAPESEKWQCAVTLLFSYFYIAAIAIKINIMLMIHESRY